MSVFEWLQSLPGRGTIMVAIGCAVLVVPHALPLSVAGLFIIEGIRLLAAEFRRLEGLDGAGFSTAAEEGEER